MAATNRMTLYVKRSQGKLILKEPDQGLISRLTIVSIGVPALVGILLGLRFIWDGYSWWQKIFVGGVLFCVPPALVYCFFFEDTDPRLEVDPVGSVITLHQRNFIRAKVVRWPLDHVVHLETIEEVRWTGDGSERCFRPELVLGDGQRIKLPWTNSVKSGVAQGVSEFNAFLADAKARSS